jgi:transposase
MFRVRVGRDGTIHASHPSFDCGKLAVLRQTRRWSRAELARRVNKLRNETGRVTADDVDQWEVGDACPCVNAGFALEAIFGLPRARGLFRVVTIRYRPKWLRLERERMGFSFRLTAKLAELTPTQLRALEGGKTGDPAEDMLLSRRVMNVLSAIGSRMPELRTAHGRRKRTAAKSPRVLRAVVEAGAAAAAM